MRKSGYELWGSARGPMRRLAPQARILCGTSVFAICLIAPVTDISGLASVAVVVGLWWGLTQPPVRVALSLLFFGLILFVPYFLLSPLILSTTAVDNWMEALLVPWTLFVRGISAMLATVFTMTTLSVSHLRQGLSRLPIPGIVSAIVIQIVHQTRFLLYETRRIAQAIALRSGTSGYRSALKILFSLPRVWLPRVMERAVRVADAMALRGYDEKSFSLVIGVNYTMTDRIAIGVSLFSLAGVVVLRLWGKQL